MATIGKSEVIFIRVLLVLVTFLLCCEVALHGVEPSHKRPSKHTKTFNEQGRRRWKKRHNAVDQTALEIDRSNRSTQNEEHHAEADTNIREPTWNDAPIMLTPRFKNGIIRTSKAYFKYLTLAQEPNTTAKRRWIKTTPSKAEIQTTPPRLKLPVETQPPITIKENIVTSVKQLPPPNIRSNPKQSETENSQKNLTPGLGGPPYTGYYGVVTLGVNHIVMYNALPKTGSRSLSTSFGILSKQPNHPVKFDLQRDEKIVNSKTAMTEFVRSLQPGTLLRSHVPFHEYHIGEIDINMMRDPVDRFVSAYYFSFFGDQEIIKSSDLQKEVMHVDDYVRAGKPVASLQLTFMCGFDCRYGLSLEEKLRRAKENVDRYLFIGVTEELEATIQVFEKLLPDFAGGITEVYKALFAERREKYRTINKEDPSEEVKLIIRERMKCEVELYEYVKQKFHDLKSKLGIVTNR